MDKNRPSLFDEIVGVKAADATPAKGPVPGSPSIEQLKEALEALYGQTGIGYDPHKSVDATSPVPALDHVAVASGSITWSAPENFPTGWTVGEPWTAEVEPAEGDQIGYKFDEMNGLEEARVHINKTYSSHYAGEIQATEVIVDAGHGTGFNVGNIIKYAKRYGKKNGYNREDILKIIHYAVMQLYVHKRDGLSD